MSRSKAEIYSHRATIPVEITLVKHSCGSTRETLVWNTREQYNGGGKRENVFRVREQDITSSIKKHLSRKQKVIHWLKNTQNKYFSLKQ